MATLLQRVAAVKPGEQGDGDSRWHVGCPADISRSHEDGDGPAAGGRAAVLQQPGDLHAKFVNLVSLIRHRRSLPLPAEAVKAALGGLRLQEPVGRGAV